MTVIYHIIKQLVLPPGLIIVLLLVGFCLSLWRFRLLGRVVVALGISLFYLLSISPVADLLLNPLESRYQPLTPERLPRVGTLVVLSGGASATDYLPVTSRLTSGSIERILEAVRLYYLMDSPRIVICGGSGNPFVQVSEAALMRELLLDLKIPDKRIFTEGASQNTFENAKGIARLRLQPPLILITSAGHMNRALHVFKAQGMNTLPAPCDFKGCWSRENPFRFFPSQGALSASTAAIYEYMGTLWYALTGKF